MAQAKYSLNKPLLIALFGFPGSGKTYFARNFAESVDIVHLHADKFRHELFQQPKYTDSENTIVTRLMQYMAEELLKAGVSVIYDTNAIRSSERRSLRDLARRTKAEHLLVWVQIDQPSAYARCKIRDHRKASDKFALQFKESAFKEYLGAMQNPVSEDYVVVSGKHNAKTQKNTLIKKLYEKNLLDTKQVTAKVAKPELVNLIPPRQVTALGVQKRNISIR